MFFALLVGDFNRLGQHSEAEDQFVTILVGLCLRPAGREYRPPIPYSEMVRAERSFNTLGESRSQRLARGTEPTPAICAILAQDTATPCLPPVLRPQWIVATAGC